MTGLAVKHATSSVGSNTVFVTGRRSMAEAMTSVGLSGAGRKMSNLKGKAVSVATIPYLNYTIAVDRPTSLGSNICTISSWYNSLSISAPSTGYMSNYADIGVKITRSTSSMAGGSVAEFKFRASNFFVSGNVTHMAVILRGVVSTTTLQGKGIIIGNVSGYGAHSGVCKPTSLPHDIGVESFWSTGNCVYGSASNPQNLKNGVIYSVKVVTNDVRKTISFRIRGEDGYDRTQVINDVFYLNSANSRDFAIGCVPDTTGRRWSMEFGDIAYYNVK